MRIVYFKHLEFRLYYNNLEVYKDGILIGEYFYNRKKNLFNQIKEIMEM